MSLRALWVIVFPAFLASLSCTRHTVAADDPEWRDLEERRLALVQKLELSRFKVERLQRLERKQEEGNAILAKVETTKARLDTLVTRRDALRLLVPDMEAQLDKTRSEQLALTREKATGLQLPSLVTRNGHRYESVKVMQVSDEGVRITHSTGSARLGIEDLDSSLAETFGLDESLQRDAEKRQQDAQDAYYRQLDQDMAAINASKAEKQLAALQIAASRPIVNTPASSQSRNSAFDRTVGLGDTVNPAARRITPVWRYGRVHYRRHYYYVYYY